MLLGSLIYSNASWSIRSSRLWRCCPVRTTYLWKVNILWADSLFSALWQCIISPFSHISTFPGPYSAILYLATTCQTFPLPFQILPLPSALHSPHSPCPSPHLHLIPSSATLYIHQPTSFLPLSVLPSCYLALCFCFWAQTWTWTWIYVPVPTCKLILSWNHWNPPVV